MTLKELTDAIEEHFEKDAPHTHPEDHPNKGERDKEMEKKVMEWIKYIVGDDPKTDFEHYIQDGCALSKVMKSIVFNSVPQEEITEDWGCDAQRDRVQAVIREMHRYGVQDVFKPEDLLARRNIPKVTRCIAELAHLAAHDKNSLLASRE